MSKVSIAQCSSSIMDSSNNTFFYLDLDSVVETLEVNGLFVPPLPEDTLPKPPEPPTVSEDSNSQSSEPQSVDDSAVRTHNYNYNP